uniref:RNA-directed DNA polymerase n=1 Tax=Strigamia maritima TaxID=126957 RepID=T1IU80_STRMM
MNYVQNGWPQHEHNVSIDAKPYYANRDDITTMDGLLFRDNKLIPPKQKRPEVLGNIHDGHLGITKMKNMAREVIWWPGISKDITNSRTNAQHAKNLNYVSGLN